MIQYHRPDRRGYNKLKLERLITIFIAEDDGYSWGKRVISLRMAQKIIIKLALASFICKLTK